LVILGQPGDLVAAKTELKITQRLRLDQHKLDDLERNIRVNVANAISHIGHSNLLNGQTSNGSILNNMRKQTSASNLMKFVVLIASPKERSNDELDTTENVKNEAATPPRQASSNGNESGLILKTEQFDPIAEDNDDDTDESSLSRLIAYLIAYVSFESTTNTIQIKLNNDLHFF
jgi:hypothetical protein